ncbi:MAG TPA: hypothetical protein PKI03_23860, partial [Pseudomonadota bacterium]|nr:hypothetical protein [Pseudomonadota bacterium]
MPTPVLRLACLLVGLSFLPLASSCSQGGAGSVVIPCSATNPCPDDLICVPGRNLCAPPLPDMAG